MYCQRLLRRVVVFISALLLFGVTYVAPVDAQATTSPKTPTGMYWKSMWELVVTFPENQLRALWTVRVVEADATTDLVTGIVAQNTLDISHDCLLVGQLPIVDGRMQFDGKSYMTCSLPSYRDELARLLPGFPRLDERCDCTDPYVTVAGRWDPGATPLIYTLFSHPDFSFTTPVDRQIVTSNLWLNQQLYASPSWPVNPTNNQVWSGINPFWFDQVINHLGMYSDWAKFLDTPPFRNTAAQRPGVLHWYDGGVLLTHPTNPNYNMHTGSVTVYIGYDPGNKGNYFQGEIEVLAVDPACGKKFKG